MVKQWPEILNDISVSSIPLAYINSIKICFSDGRLWEISLTSPNKDKIAEQVDNLVTELDDEIVKIDFDLNIKQLKTDIEKTTNNVL